MQNIAFQISASPAPQAKHDVATNPSIEASKLSNMLYKSVFAALDGPQGVKPADLVVALGALAGYAARWTVHHQIANGEVEDDFKVPAGSNRPFISTSHQVNRNVTDLTTESFAGVLTHSMMAAGANWLPQVDQGIEHNFVSINQPGYPDYSIGCEHWPQLPPQAVLMMMWEPQARILAHTPGAPEVAVKAYALAVTKAAQAFKEQLTMDRAAQLALETAIATSKLNYAF